MVALIVLNPTIVKLELLTAELVASGGNPKSTLADAAKVAYLSVNPNADFSPAASADEKAYWASFRHTYISAKLTQYYGGDVARVMGDVNETFNLQNNNTDGAVQDQRVDDYNNDKGIEIGNGSPKSGGLLGVDEVLAETIFNKVLNNELATKPSEIPEGYDHEPSLIGAELVQDFVQSLDTLGIGGWIKLLGLGMPIPVFLATIIQGALDAYDKGPSGLSPLVLDLNGDGVSVSALAYGTVGSHVYFDMDNDGFAERTAWATGGDGMLAIDRNGNGKIDNQSELFGNNATYADGFANLKQYDSNNDNKITSADTQFANLRVWVDADSDGQTDSGELKTLSSLGITQINVNATPNTSGTYLNGNLVSADSTFIMNGATKAVSDVWFLADQRDTHYTGDVTLDVRTLFLPTLKGFGNVKDLHIAMSQDASLLTLVQNFVTGWNVNKFGSTSLNTEVQNILFKWAGVENEALNINVVGMYGQIANPYDTREISFMQKITGSPYTLSQLETLEEAELGIFHGAYQSLLNSFKAQLILQSGGDSLFSTAPSYNIATGEFSGGVLSSTAISGLSTIAANSGHTYDYWKSVISMLSAVKNLEDYSTNEINAVNNAISASGVSAVWSTFVSDIYDDDNPVNLDQSRTNDMGSNYTAAVHFVGTNGGDALSGNRGDDFLEGRGGNDILRGLWGNDTLDGGSGNNTLSGGEGNDTYIHHKGSLDTFSESLDGQTGGVDVIKFKGNYTASQITLGRSALVGDSDTLNIFINGQKEIIVSQNFGSVYGDQRIDKIVFDDGTQINLTSLTSNILGATGNDTLTGPDNPLMKDDAIYSLEGNDILKGGKGNDYLNGAQGNDTYLFSLGDGVDVVEDSAGADIISFSADIPKTSVLYGRIGGDLIIYYGASDQITIRGHYSEEIGVSAPAGYKLETLKFSDNTTVNLAGILDLSGTSGDDYIEGNSTTEKLYGLAGNDTISGKAGDDTYIGGTGNDILSGTTGNNIYQFSIGDGVDTIQDNGGTNDVIKFSAGITATNFRLENDGAGNLNIYYGTSDKIKIADQFTYGGVEKIILSDNITYVLTAGLTYTGTAGADNVMGTSFNDTLIGLAGDDVLYGAGGTDIYTGGTGNDILVGNSGNDTYQFSIGDGVDTIQDNGGTNDVIKFSAGITATNFRLENDGAGNLNIYYGTSDKIKIADQFTYGGVEKIILSDNTTYVLTAGLTFKGTSGDDYIAGTNYNDIINGLAGNDTLYGGNGVDTATYVDSTSFVNVNLAITTAQNTIGAGTDTLIGIENLTGSSYNDTLTGDANANIIEGGLGNDILNGGAGIDTVSYASSTAAVAVNLATTMAQNTIGAGTDTITGFENILGSSYNDSLIGDANANTITGGDGNDVIQGGLGNDILIGGNGIDTVSYTSATAAVTVNLATTTAQNTIAAGTDTITGFENILGSSYNDTLTGDANANNIQGGLGNDILNGGAGIDTVSYAAATAAVIVNLGLTSAQNTGGAGTDTLSNFENIFASAFNDTLTGSSSANTINGGAGNDLIVGGLGADTLTGGLGADTFQFLSTGLDTTIDRITDFSTSQGDKFDVKNILVGYDAVTKAITDFVEFTTVGANTVIKVDRDGLGTTYGWQQIAQLDNVTGLTDESALKASGNLVA